MSEFNLKLREAQAIQRRRYMGVASALLLGGFVLVTLFAYLTGTTIKIEPAEAEETGQVRVLDGLGISLSKGIYTLSDPTEINVSAQGFAPKTITVTAQNRGQYVSVRLAELPGHLTATTTPEQPITRWKINGTRAAIGPSLDRDLASGAYTIEANSPYFEIERHEITIKRAEIRTLDLPLKPVEGQVRVLSDPTGARVALDGSEAGKTPIVLKVIGGMHNISLQNEGYITVSEALEITNADRDIERNYRLLRQTSRLRVVPEPSGGTLLINGQKKKMKGPHQVPSNKEAVIAYSKSGYFTQTETVTLKPGEERTVRIRLKPDMGRVEVTSRPRSTVYVDTKEVGVTPLTLDLPSRPHLISLKRPGYRLVERTVVPSSKKPIAVRETLQTEEKAKLTDTPREYVNEIGIELLRFEPTAFKMGAPRHEKGQRANEFQRRIKLTRSFFAARHETTNDQFAKFNKDHKGSGDAGSPVTSVTWLDAVQFCNWLSRQENLEPFYEVIQGRVRKINTSANGYRLLSEAEWEWLARRAGKSSQSVFPWGDNAVVPPMTGNIADETAKGLAPFYVPNYTDGFAGVAPVGQFSAEPSGLFDLTGNVSEWVHDVYSLQPPASNQIETDPISTLAGSNRVIKGSNWRSGTRSTLRAAFRDGLVDRRDDVGFRIGRYL